MHGCHSSGAAKVRRKVPGHYVPQVERTEGAERARASQRPSWRRGACWAGKDLRLELLTQGHIGSELLSWLACPTLLVGA